MHSLSTVCGKNVYYKIVCLCTLSSCLRLYFIFNLFTAVLCFYTNALYLDDSVTTFMFCADLQCKGVISYAETQGSYPSRDARMLSFTPGKTVTVYAKPAYDTMKLVFGEIDGKKGYIPMNMIREKKVLKRNLVSVMLPKGISNVVEDNSDNNSDKSTAGVLPHPETIGSSVIQDTVTPASKETVSDPNTVQSSSGEKKNLSSSSNSSRTDNQENKSSGVSLSNTSTPVPLDNIKVESEKKSDTENNTGGNATEETPTVVSTESSHSVTNESSANFKNASSNLLSSNLKDPILENKTVKSNVADSLSLESRENNKINKFSNSVAGQNIDKDSFVPSSDQQSANKDINPKEKKYDLSTGISSGNTQVKNEKHPSGELNLTVANKTDSLQNEEVSDKSLGVNLTSNQGETIENSREEVAGRKNEKVKSENFVVNSGEYPQNKEINGVNGEASLNTEKEDLTTVISSGNTEVKNEKHSSGELNLTVANKTDSLQNEEVSDKSSGVNLTSNQGEMIENSREEVTGRKNEKAANMAENFVVNSGEYPQNKEINGVNGETSLNTEKEDQIHSRVQEKELNIGVERDTGKSGDASIKVDLTNTHSQLGSDIKSKKENDLHAVPNSKVESTTVSASVSEERKSEHYANSVEYSEKLVPGKTEEIVMNENKSILTEENEVSEGNTKTSEFDLKGEADENIVTQNKNDSKHIEAGNDVREIEGSEEVQTEVLGSESRESRHSKYKITLNTVDNESVSRSVVTEETETLSPDSMLGSSPIRNSYEGSTASASILFTIIPREYVDILRIYVTIFSDMLPDNLKIILASLRISSHVVVLTFLCGALWLTMYFIGALFNLFNKDSALRAELCDFQVKFFKMKSERDSLRNLLKNEEEKCFEFDEKISEREQKIAFLEREFDRVKKERVELQEKVTALEADVTLATDAGREVNEVLSHFLTSQKENVSLNTKMESLQQQITKQEEFISQLRKSYRSTKEENAELKHMQEKASAELERLTHLLDDADANLKKFQSNNEALKSSNNEMLQQLKDLEESKTNLIYELRKFEEEKEERDALNKKLKEEISCLNSIVEEKTSEIKSLREVIRSLNEDTEDNVDDLFDVAKVKTELDVLQKEKSEIELKYENVVSERKKLMETLLSIEESNAECKANEEKALKEKVDAQNNLEILKNYFAAKEAELQQKVGTLQVSKQQREADANSLIDRLKFLEEENVAYKSQIETMTKELLDSDKNWKAQLAKMEKKAHENWVAARNTHRELEALKSDSAALRQHLSMKAKAKSTVDGNSSLDDDDEPMPLPSFMPPPPPFAPFPPYEDKGDPRRWEGESNFTAPPPPPPMPPFGVDFENMPPIPQLYNSLPSHHQSLSHPVGNHPMQWDSPSSRDAFSPISQQSHERRSSRGTSPMHSTFSGSSSVRGTMPASNFAPFTSHQMYTGSAQFSNPASHWTRPNGNLTNNAINKQNHEKKRSRSDSRNSMSNASLHASNV